MEALIQMTGYAGGDVTLRSTGGGVAVADFRLACTPRVLRNEQWVDTETTWLTVKAFRTLAENVAGSIRRGDPVVVIGRLRTVTWTKDSITHERLELEATVVGHDLGRGRATFHRRSAETDRPVDAYSDGDRAEPRDGDRPEERVGDDPFAIEEQSGDREAELVGAAG